MQYYIDMLHALLSIAVASLYVGETYLPEKSHSFDQVNLSLCICFTVGYLFQLFIAESFISQIASFDSVIDLRRRGSAAVHNLQARG